MLLGAAQYLSTHRDFDGTVVFIFQPAEEGGNAGARAMMQDGLFDRFPCDAVFGIHNMPGMPVNQFGFRAGPTMASSNRWDIVIKGVGGHAAQPHASVDPIIVAADMVHALQTVISRSKNPLEQAVLSITQIHAGDAYNVIPGEAVLRGTVRTYSVETLDKIEADMRRIATTLPQVYGGTGELDFVRAYPPLVNWEQETAFAAQVAENAFGAEHVLRDMPPFMGAEDSRSSWRKCRAPICSGQWRWRPSHGKLSRHGSVPAAQPELRFQRRAAAGGRHVLGQAGSGLPACGKVAGGGFHADFSLAYKLST